MVPLDRGLGLCSSRHVYKKKETKTRLRGITTLRGGQGERLPGGPHHYYDHHHTYIQQRLRRLYYYYYGTRARAPAAPAGPRTVRIRAPGEQPKGRHSTVVRRPVNKGGQKTRGLTHTRRHTNRQTTRQTKRREITDTRWRRRVRARGRGRESERSSVAGRKGTKGCAEVCRG